MPTISKSEAIRSGIPKKTLQTILIPNDYSLKESRAWLKDHNYSNAYYRNTKNFRRWMQVFPIRGASYYSNVLNNGIELIYQEY